MAFFLALGRFLTGNLWRTAALALLAFALAQTVHANHLRADLKLCRANSELQAATIRDTTSKAQAADLEHALTVERTNARIAQEKQHVLEDQLDAAHRTVADYARLHRPPAADPGRGAAPGEPQAPDATASPDGQAPQAIVPVADLDACAVDYTVAAGWQEWWKAVSQAQAVTDASEGAPAAQ